jgi:hypothetical protein
MPGKLPRARAKHEAAHAVVARKLGLAVDYVDARSDNPHTASHSAAYAAASSDDVAFQVGANENDAMVALAGREADRRDFPKIPAFDLLTDDEQDILNARSATYSIVCLLSERSLPEPQADGEIGIEMEMNGPVVVQMHEVYRRLLGRTASLVEQHWSVIERVAKHLERHGRIDGQSKLDDLIERAERVAALK